MFEPVNTGRISGEIVEQIKSAIHAGKLAPGDQLPPERDLTKQLGVSRVSVRDALRMLEAHGLIEVRVGARGGAFVTAPAPHLVGESLANMIFLAGLTPADVTEARIVFEHGVVELACERAGADDLAALQEICDRSEAALAAGEYDVSLSAEFHTRLARAAHNEALGLIAQAFHGPLLRSLQEAKQVDPKAGRIGVAEHRLLVEAIRARDVESARRILAQHLGRTARRVGAKKRTAA